MIILHCFPTALKLQRAFERAIMAIPEDEKSFVNSTQREIVTTDARHLFRVVAGQEDLLRLKGFEFAAVSLYPEIPEEVAVGVLARLRSEPAPTH